MEVALKQDIHISKKDELWHLYAIEGADLIIKQKEIHGMVTSEPNINASGKLAERLTYQVHLYEAKHGTLPNESQILVMKDAIQIHTKSLDFIKDHPASEDIKDLSIHRGLEAVCGKALRRYEVHTDDNKQGFERGVQSEITELSKQKELEAIQNQMLEKQQALEKDISRGLSL